MRSKHIVSNVQFVGIGMLIGAVAYGWLYGLLPMLLPREGLFVSFGAIILGLLVFLIPLVTGPMKRSIRMSMGQKIFDFFDRAGLTEKDMRTVISFAKEGYKLGFSQPNEPPYIAVMLTVKKFEPTEIPKDSDYYPWEQAIAMIEKGEIPSDDGLLTCPMCGKKVENACEECGWKPN